MTLRSCKLGIHSLIHGKLVSFRPILDTTHNPWSATAVASYQNWKPQEKLEEIDFPFEKRKLQFMEKTPQPQFGGKHAKQPRRLLDIRGPEEYQHFLLHKQFGIRATKGGDMHWGHIDMIRLGINRKMDDSCMFALWRIDAPWKPVTKKGQGKRMGGGKGAIDKFVTPIKAGRVLVEVGGKCSFEEVYPMLNMVARKLPFPAEVVNQEKLDAEQENEEYLEKNNLNPFSFKYCLENNMHGCKAWVSPYDIHWHGKHR